MHVARPLDLSPLAEPPTRALVAEHRRLLREQGRASRTAGQRIALVFVLAFAVAIALTVPVGIVVAIVTDDPDRRASALVAASIVGALVLIATIVAVRSGRGTSGAAVLAFARRNGLAFTAWMPRTRASSGPFVVGAHQHDLDVVRDADGVSWGRSTITVTSRPGPGPTTLAFVAVPLHADVPAVMVADVRTPAPTSIAPHAVGAVELAASTPTPWRVWTTEPDVQAAAAVVDERLLAALESTAPGLSLELSGDHAYLVRIVDARWRGDDVDWHALVDEVRARLVPVLRDLAASRRGQRWAADADDEPLGRSLRRDLVRRGRRRELVDGALEIASGGAS